MFSGQTFVNGFPARTEESYLELGQSSQLGLKSPTWNRTRVPSWDSKVLPGTGRAFSAGTEKSYLEVSPFFDLVSHGFRLYVMSFF